MPAASASTPWTATLYYEYSALLLKRDKIEVGPLPAGEVTIAFEMRTPMERAAPAELKFWINGEGGGHGRHGPAHRARTCSRLGDLRRGHGHQLAGGRRLLRQGALRLRGNELKLTPEGGPTVDRADSIRGREALPRPSRTGRDPGRGGARRGLEPARRAGVAAGARRRFRGREGHRGPGQRDDRRSSRPAGVGELHSRPEAAKRGRARPIPPRLRDGGPEARPRRAIGGTRGVLSRHSRNQTNDDNLAVLGAAAAVHLPPGAAGRTRVCPS
jgi:hypothetical protein